MAMNTLTLDQTRTESFRGKLRSVMQRHGSLDVLILNAGIHIGGALETVSMDELRRLMQTNFFGPVALARAAVSCMRKQGTGGRIIAISSLSGLAAPACDGAYAASKHALEGAFEALRHEVDRWGIYIALAHFGSIDSDLMRTPPGHRRDAGPYAALEQAVYARAQLPEAGSAEHVASQLPTIARSLPGPLRWACDDAARKVFHTLGYDRNRERERLLRQVDGSAWWRDGLAAPDAGNGGPA